jgi:hypothetical protein
MQFAIVAGYSDEELLETARSAIAAARLVKDPDQGSKTGLPEKFGISSVYPNPFNSRVGISVEIPSEGHLKATVYDILGRETAYIYDKFVQAGTRKIHWDGKNSNGLQVSSGLYLIEVSWKNHNISKKLLYIR